MTASSSSQCKITVVSARKCWRFTAVLALVGLICPVVRAGDIDFRSGPEKVHLLELFTSEGCSSCPPAEAWLSGLQKNAGLWRDFVPVAFHVDYWDALGWRDRYASREWTLRQRRYADQWHATAVYTPAMVLDGAEWREAHAPPRSAENVGVLALKVRGRDVVTMFHPANELPSGYEMYFATLGSNLFTDVRAGENQGHKLVHDFVVLSLQKGPVSREGGETRFTLERSNLAQISATAAWVTRPGDLIPIQAVGGSLR